MLCYKHAHEKECLRLRECLKPIELSWRERDWKVQDDRQWIVLAVAGPGGSQCC